MSAGLGVMLSVLSGRKRESVERYYGKRISSIWLEENFKETRNLADQALRIDFEDGTKIAIFDDGQSCCEARYLRTDDDLQCLVGKVFECAVVKSHEDKTEEYSDHEQLFIELRASSGESVTFCAHNEHNGYYSGFSMVVQQLAETAQ